MANSWLIGGAFGIVAGIVLAPVVAVPVAVALGVGGIAWASTAIGCGVVAGSMAIGTGIGVAIDVNNAKTSSDETFTRNEEFLDGSGKANKPNSASHVTKEVGANFTGGDAPKELNQNQSQTKENKARVQQKGVQFATKDGGHPERIIGTPTNDPQMHAIKNDDIDAFTAITPKTDATNYGYLLEHAAKYGSTKIVTKLIKDGADVNRANHKGETPVMFAAQNGNAEVVNALIEAKANVNKADYKKVTALGIKGGKTALMFAARNGHTDVVKILIKAGANVNKADNNGRTVLMYADLYSHTEIAGILRKAGAKDVGKLHTVKDDDDIDKSTELMIAVRNGDTKEVNILIANKKDVNHQNPDGYNALIYAATNNEGAEIVDALIVAGADVNAAVYHFQYNGGFTALMFASQMGHDEVVKILIKKEGLDVNKADENGRTALMFAAQNGHAEVVKILIKKEGLDVDKADKKGNTALMFAARNGDAGIFDALIGAGADVNKTNRKNETALMIADRNGHTDIVSLINAKLLATKTTSPSPSPSSVANSPYDRLPLTGSSTNQTPKGHNP
jgi:ankyrin repeat protein